MALHIKFTRSRAVYVEGAYVGEYEVRYGGSSHTRASYFLVAWDGVVAHGRVRRDLEEAIIDAAARRMAA